MRYTIGLTAALVAALACALAAAPVALGQGSFPTRPVRIVVAYPPGGGIDIMARQLAERLAPQWGQPVVVENRPGASTIPATELVAKSAPDAMIQRMTSTFDQPASQPPYSTDRGGHAAHPASSVLSSAAGEQRTELAGELRQPNANYGRMARQQHLAETLNGAGIDLADPVQDRSVLVIAAR
jgi:hypothetical protein